MISLSVQYLRSEFDVALLQYQKNLTNSKGICYLIGNIE